MFSKGFEKAAYNKCLCFINSNNIVYNFALEKNLLTYMAFLELSENNSESVDGREITVGDFIDLAKAFDTVNHKILLDKLYHHGTRGFTTQVDQQLFRTGNNMLA